MSATAQTQITLRNRETILKQFQENTNPATSNVHAENALILEVLLDLRDLMIVFLGGSANGVALLSEIRDLIKLPIDSHFIEEAPKRDGGHEATRPDGEAAAYRGEPHEG